ncbi:MAG: Lrp/AsnC family transcriptional regulator [Acidobacteriota bacterium]|nr:Lrp/AsnC family transcriptional regulator [Acidobacteriota bacterium]
MIDETDRKILALLQEDARLSNAEIARRVGMASSAIHERIRKLEERGVITGYHARIDAGNLGYGLLAYIFVKTTDGCWCHDTASRLSALDEVLSVHSITGEDCYLVKVRSRDTGSLNAMLRDKFSSIDSIISTKTTIVLETTKDTLNLPLDIEEQVSA